MRQQFVKEYTLKSKPTQRECKQINGSQDAFSEFCALYDPNTQGIYETAYALYLNQDNRVKGFLKLSDGGMTNVIVDPRVLMMGALGCMATAIVLCHNHPSGNPRPSEDDRLLTKKLLAACKLMDISFIDHIVMGAGRYYSFRDHGEMIM